MKRSPGGPSSENRIAIIGMSAVFPGARDLAEYWDNILEGKYTVTEVPPDRWQLETYFDENPRARDKVYSKWGGFLDPVEFDPLRYSIPPKALEAIDPSQLLTLEVVDRALRDGGLLERGFDREHTSCFVGEGGGLGNLGQAYALRALLPMYLEHVPEEVLEQLPAWTEDSFPGLLPNVIAGRIANYYDLGGTNLSASAACAAGLAAVSLGMAELQSGRSNVSICAGVDVQQNPFTYLCFSKTPALSPTGTPRCFDARGDGIVISQGIGAVILKRLADAERDGDPIYAVLSGIGTSSDGRGKSLTAPTAPGQLRAMRRAYAESGFDVSTVGLLEAHGTGTVLGDRTEAQSINEALREAGTAPASCAVGTVKSMIGHTKGCAGIAGLVKVALSLRHQVLPPTLWVEQPTAPELWSGDSPAYLNTELRPWIHPGHPRRAAVNSFGFGGTNFHAVLEEYPRTGEESLRFPGGGLPAELLCLAGPSAPALRDDLGRMQEQIEAGTTLASLARTAHQGLAGRGPGAARLAVIAESLDDLRAKIGRARDRLAAGKPFEDPTGVFFEPEPVGGKVAFVFPGQGSQRVDMLKDLAVFFHEVRETFATADRALESRLPRRLSQYVFPPSRFDREQEEAAMAALTRTEVAQPALGAAAMGVRRLLAAFGVEPDMTAGHSSGEYSALCAAGVFPEEELYRLLWARGSCMVRACGDDAGTMLAVRGERAEVESLCAGREGLYPANFNAPLQTVVSGRRENLEALVPLLEARGMQARFLPVACGFHSPFVAEAARTFEAELAAVRYATPGIPPYSNFLAAPFPNAEEEIRQVLSSHLSQPVRFMDEIARMHEDGARVFVEPGAGRVCTTLIRDILEGRPFAAIACDGAPARNGFVRFLHGLGQLFASGVDLRLDPLFDRRHPEVAGPVFSKLTWLVSPEVSWPADQPRPVVRPVPAPAAIPAPTPAPPPAPTAAPSISPEMAEVILRHQRLMTSFLDQQRAIMMGYLGAGEPDDRGLLPPSASGPEVFHSAPPTGQLPAAAEPAPIAAPAPPPAPRPAPVPSPAPAPTAGPATSAPELETALLTLVSERTGYPEEMLERDQDLEADLGIDSIKRVEILTAFARRFPGLDTSSTDRLQAARTLGEVLDVMATGLGSSRPPSGEAVPAAAAPSPPAGEGPSRRELEPTLLALVAERTGYPEEMLEPDQDLEADLGIDSIKRVEILTAFAKQVPGLDTSATERLQAARTLGEVLDVMATASPAAAPSTSPASPTAAAPGAPRTPVSAPAAGPASRSQLQDRLTALIAERTGYPVEMLDADQDLEADLGIDSIKRVEILTAFGRQMPALDTASTTQLQAARTLGDVLDVAVAALAGPAPDAAPPAEAMGPAAVERSRSEVLEKLTSLIAERTGYPVEMLEPEQDLEADLGIDSIKRVEILTAFVKEFPDLAVSSTERLQAARTLGDVIDVVLTRPAGAGPAAAAPAEPVAAASAEPVAAPATPPAAAGLPDEATLLERLQALISERTGYPAEMLEADQDLEGDLGIDSIKRVEILTAFGKQLPDLGPAASEPLQAARSMHDVVQVILAHAGAAAAAGPASPAPIPVEEHRQDDPLDRFVITMKTVPIPEGRTPRIPPGAILITDDGDGRAAALQRQLRAMGGVAIRLAPDGPDRPEEDLLHVDLADPVAVEAVVERLRSAHGGIGGVLHLLPLRSTPSVEELPAPAWQQMIDQEVKGLFHLLRSAAPDLRSRAGTWAVAALSFGGSAADGRLPEPDRPWRGGAVGLLKTVAVEWPDVITRSVILEEDAVERAAEHVLAELAATGDGVESYRRGGERQVPDARKLPLNGAAPVLEIDPEDVIVLVGGARGITAEVGLEIARRHHPTLILVGRSPWPEEEGPATAGLDDERELKRALLEEMRAAGGAPTPERSAPRPGGSAWTGRCARPGRRWRRQAPGSSTTAPICGRRRPRPPCSRSSTRPTAGWTA
jgi:acyl transferase domain-containing protein/acyl carrier protein/NAD(P)-dependent dehydrogenase (short-subunit alcohol dehydrogenase family)